MRLKGKIKRFARAVNKRYDRALSGRRNEKVSHRKLIPVLLLFPVHINSAAIILHVLHCYLKQQLKRQHPISQSHRFKHNVITNVVPECLSWLRRVGFTVFS